MPEVTSLTTITIPLDEVFPPEPWHDIPEQWKQVFRPLHNAAGFMGGILGRGIEHPEKGLIIAGWRSMEQLTAFASSPEGIEYESNLASLSQYPPTTIQVEFFDMYMVIEKNGMWPSKAAEVHMVDFPRDLRESITPQLRELRGMVDKIWCGGIDGANSAYRKKQAYLGPPWRGWVTRQPSDDIDVDQAAWIHSWRSRQREKKYKDTEVRTMSDLAPGVGRDEDGNTERVWPIEEHFEEQLRHLGALNITKEHYKLAQFPLM